MNRFLGFIIFITSSLYCSAQKTTCNCPANDYQTYMTKPDKIFNLSDGHCIALCGSGAQYSPELLMSEFSLVGCGQDSIIQFWDGTINCKIRVFKDTLLVSQFKEFPIGENFTMQEIAWWVDRIYYAKNKLVQKGRINRTIRLYTKKQSNEVIKEYCSAGGQLNDSTMVLAERLYIAAISGSKQARSYLVNFRKRYTLDGAFAEEHDDLITMLALWDDKRF